MQAAALPSDAAESFTLNLAMVTPRCELAEWLRLAAPGHEAVFCVGMHLPKASDAAVAVRRWEAEGRVELLPVRRDPDGRRWQWRVRKVSNVQPYTLAAASAPAGRAPLADTPRALDRGVLSKLMDVLRRCAERDEPCPSNGEFAKRLGLGSGETARKLAESYLRRLKAERRIAVQNRGRNAARVVTIIVAGRAQGRSTRA